MIFRPVPIAGAFAVLPEPITDERGGFARTVALDDFERNGCDGNFVEQSVAWNSTCGTLRGMHFARHPHGEGKLVRCTRGAVFDVLVDVRGDSPTFGQWYAERLDEENRTALYMPPGVAHGYLTLVGNTELVYAMTTRYNPGAAAGFQYDDDRIGIRWPAAPALVSARDRALPPFPG